MVAGGVENIGPRPQPRAVVDAAITLEQSEPFVPGTDAFLAELEADIESFFVVPDSVRAQLAPDDDLVIRLQETYAVGGDTQTRQMLAVAYMDRAMYKEVQILLAPSWGADLSPEEEILLLSVDRHLGEVKRSDELAEAVL